MASPGRSAAVHQLGHPEAFTERYNALLRHYGVEGRKTNPRSPHENGDIEQRHFRFVRAIEQSLMLRGSGDFASRHEYEAFLCKIRAQLNAGRQEKLAEELAVLRPLPAQRTEDYTRLEMAVSRFSTIRVLVSASSMRCPSSSCSSESVTTKALPPGRALGDMPEGVIWCLLYPPSPAISSSERSRPLSMFTFERSNFSTVA